MLELFKKLLPHQCLGGVWSRRSEKSHTHEAATVLATVSQFNAVSLRVISTVLMETAEHRAQVITTWIHIAQVKMVLPYNANVYYAMIRSDELNFILRKKRDDERGTPDNNKPFGIWGEERVEGAIFNIYLKKVRYHRPAKSISSDSDDDISHLEWETVKVRFIKAGTLEKLVECLATDDGEVESTYINIFLATYRTFATAKQVLDLLLNRHSLHYKATGNTKLRGTLNTEQTRRDHRKRYLVPSAVHNPPALPSRPQSPATVIKELFKKLLPHQCLGGVWSRRSEKSHTHEAATVLATVSQFNAVSLRVISTVLMETAEHRAQVITTWIHIAQELRVLKNFSSLKAIISGLQSNPVFRLKSTWSQVSKDKLEMYGELERIFSEENNQWTQRELLMREGTAKFADTVGENDKHLQKIISRQHHCGNVSNGTIPYLGTFLTDLTMIDTAIPDTLPDGLINFDKKRKEFEVLAQIHIANQTRVSGTVGEAPIYRIPH
ncbi:ral guanine nucleotide dissociation stimulator-like 1 [Diaphorina citri]|uniref:Ral guanine nucleotide dissociation stimulator-like 1 n=2 Tax=Diaphorina citri TaxID=121845 RepID=A0A3Q0J3P9_DIACI|nr:ral guanine nucleotide dissociation stimulator-like 1 [Diaphorina citri]